MPTPRKTGSLCPVCLKTLPAVITEANGEARISRTCPEHGEFSAVIWRGEPSLSQWSRPKNPGGAGHAETERAKGCPHDCGICNEHKQHGCTVLFEITQACNLGCPVCFASSGSQAPFTPLAELENQLRWIHRREAGAVLQISGGEPTLHPDLPALVRLAAPLFPAVQLNTNGLRLAESPTLCRELAEAGLSWVFLQFDGVNDDIYRVIRGRALLAQKTAAIENCRAVGLGVVLVPTLARGVNDKALGEIIDFAIERSPTVRGVHIQPMAVMGRNLVSAEAQNQITLPEVLRLLEEQSHGRIRREHASPPGCEHERCSFHCRYLLRPGGELKPIREQSCCCSAATSVARPIETLDNIKQNYNDSGAGTAINTIIRTWSSPVTPPEELEPQDELSRFIREARQSTFSVTCMAFQDAMTVDTERLKGCCVHVYAPPARLVPFCAYNITSASGLPLHRGR